MNLGYYVKTCFPLLTSLTIIPVTVSANVSIPGASIHTGYDRVYSSSGLSCDSSQEPDMYFQFGALANKDRNDSRNANNYYENDDYGVYAQVVVPISDNRKRLDCSRLYELELKRLEAEIKNLKIESELAELYKTELDAIPD